MICCSSSLPILQTPQELLNYLVNMAPRLGSDTIASCTFSTSSGDIALSNQDFTTETVTFWLTGGFSGNFYTITLTIRTAGGLVMQETILYACLLNRLV
jgi:hypothetical protein